jgi:hypothetical protein
MSEVFAPAPKPESPLGRWRVLSPKAGLRYAERNFTVDTGLTVRSGFLRTFWAECLSEKRGKISWAP